MTREELFKRGWESIGQDGPLEYFAREDEHGSIQYIPFHNGNTLGMVETKNKTVITLLYDYISKKITNQKGCMQMNDKELIKKLQKDFHEPINFNEEEVIFELRKFHDGTFSVMARIWIPQKKFYEHPTFINLTEEEAKNRCQEVIQNPPNIREIVQKWEFIGS